MTEAARLEDQWRRAFAWIEQTLGGRIVAAERQPRWRPAWFLELERGGERLPLYFRGERGETDHGVYTLEHEMRVLQALETQGIPVPHVYGFCPEPHGIVMQRAPGRANLATAADEAERVAVLDHYMELLARMHAIDVSAFDSLGLSRPSSPEQLGLLDFDVWERAFRKHKRHPEPALEFLIRWVRRNLPRERKRASLVCCDSGQFLFERGRVTALIDLELACLGDPAADLGGLPGRDLSEPLGDLSRAVRRYEEFLGEPVERSVVDFHTVRFSLVTPLSLSRLVASPPPGSDFVQYLSWYLVWTRGPLEIIAARMGLALEPPELPPPAPSVPAQPAAAPGDAFESYQADREARIGIYRERRARLGPALEAQDRDDAAKLLGRRCAGPAETDAALEAFVAAARGEHDAALIGYFWRRLLREEAIAAPVMRELRDAHMQIIR